MFSGNLLLVFPCGRWRGGPDLTAQTRDAPRGAATACGTVLRYTAHREATPSGRAGRTSLGERAGFHGSHVVASENAATQIRKRFLMTALPIESPHARRRRRGRTRPGSSARVAARIEPGAARAGAAGRAPESPAPEAGPRPPWPGWPRCTRASPNWAFPGRWSTRWPRPASPCRSRSRRPRCRMHWPGWTSWAVAGPAPARRSGSAIPLAAGLADGFTSAGRPRGLVLVPTRELASQVQAVLAPLAGRWT